MNTTVKIFSKNSSHTISHAASNNSYQACKMTADSTVEITAKAVATSHTDSNNSDQACEITADSAVEITAKALAYIFIFLVSFFGNILVLVIIYKNKQPRTSINYFVFNIAASDFFNPLTIMTEKIVEIVSRSSS